MSPPDRERLTSEVSEPEPDPPRWTWDDAAPDVTPFALGSLFVALLCTSVGVLVLGYSLVAALLSR